MIVTFQLDTSREADDATLGSILSALGAAPASEAPAPKPRKHKTEPVSGNPDATPSATAAPATAPTKAELGDMIQKLAKEKGRAVAVGVLEKFRPEGFTAELVKVSVVPAERYAELGAAIGAAM